MVWSVMAAQAEKGTIKPIAQKRSELSLSRFLAAAQAEFSVNGYRGAILSNIVEDAGYSIGAFYKRFKSKEDLFFALHHKRCADARVNIDRFFSNPRCETEPVPDTLTRLVANEYRDMQAYAGYYRAFVELSQLNAPVWESMTDLEAHQGLCVAELLVRHGLTTMSDQLAYDAQLAVKTVHYYLSMHVIMRIANFAPNEDHVAHKLSQIFLTFTGVADIVRTRVGDQLNGDRRVQA